MLINTKILPPTFYILNFAKNLRTSNTRAKMDYKFTLISINLSCHLKSLLMLF